MTSSKLDFCRLCFREDGNISVFEYECSDDSWSLPDRIFECVSVQISQDDKLPQTVCQSCLDHVIRWCDFKTTCDRNQRSWFLWLKSLSFKTPEEIREGLANNARKKCVDFGYKPKSLCELKKGAFQPYEKSDVSRHNHSNEYIMVPQEEMDLESRNSYTKGPRIESTVSLVDFDKRDRRNSLNQNLTNGLLIVNSNTGPEKGGQNVASSDKHSINLSLSSEIHEVSEKVSEDSITPQEATDSRSNCDHSASLVDGTDNILTFNERLNSLTENPNNIQDVEDSDYEVESAFNVEETDVDDAITDRELALLNGEDLPVDNQNNAKFNPETFCSPSSVPVIDSLSSTKRSLPEVPRFNSSLPTDILKTKLKSQENFSTPKPIQQPRRPDTPYPHELLKNLADKMSENRSFISSSLTPSNSVPSQASGMFACPGPVPSKLETLLRPVSLRQLLSRPVTPPPQIMAFDEGMSESSPSASDSNSYNGMHFGFRVKQEPVSDEEDIEDDNESIYDNSYNAISIKMEPVDPFHQPNEQETLPEEEQLKPNCTFCKLCRKKFSTHMQFLRHEENSKVHKRISSFAALGHKIDGKVIAQLSKEVRSQARFKAFATKKMIDMEKKSNEKETAPELLSSSPSIRQINPNLLECKICNLVLQSRSHKVKHDNSKTHLFNLEAQINAERNSSLTEVVSAAPQNSRQVTVGGPSAAQSMTYTCPFASCNSVFADGGQLIVHMHTHGISLPIYETNKQIQLSQQRTQLKQPEEPVSTNTLNSNKVVQPAPPPTIQEALQNKKKRSQSRPLLTEVAAGTGPYTCRRCNRSFLKALALSNHLRSCRFAPAPARIAGPPSEKCPVCLIPQKNKKCLSYHMKTYHKTDNSLQPPTSEPAVNIEVESHNFTCPQCGKGFHARTNLASHIHKVHRKIPATCKICLKAFSSRSNLSCHYKIHFNLKDGQYICHNCFQVFNTRKESYIHRKAGCSLKIKVFSCTECIFSFKSQASLDEHRKEQHSIKQEIEVPPPLDMSCLDDPNNTRCNLCPDKTYANYCNLKRHFKEKHMNESASGINERSRVSYSEPSPPHSFAPTEISSSDSRSHSSSTLDSDKGVDCLYCEQRYSSRKGMLHHMKNYCKLVPAMVKCRYCKSERWPWSVGPCKQCGKDFNVRPRNRSTSISEPLSKKPKLSETLPPSTSQPLSTAASDNYQSKTSVVVKKSIPSKVPLYRCPVGKRSFLCQKTMFNHSASCDGSCKDQAVYCKVCHQLYPNPKIYLKHKPCSGRKSQANDATITSKTATSTGHQDASLMISSNQTSDSEKMYPCGLCNQTFKTSNYCHKHLRTCHQVYSRGRYTRRGVNYNSIDADEIHVKNEISEAPFPGFDDKESSSQVISALDNNTDLSVGPAYCQTCSKNFNDADSLSEHIKNFHKNRFSKIDCTFCSKNILKRELYEHGFNCIRGQLVHINTLECVVCSTIFYSSDDEDTISLKLQEHIMNCCGKLTTKKGEKYKNKEKFLCLKCCMLFSSKKSLYGHSFERHGILIQTSPTTQQKMPKVEPPVSEINETGSLASSNIVSQDFTSAKPIALYKCNRCYKTFRTQKGLRCHKSNAHIYQARKKIKGKVLLKCKFCQRQFFNELKLRNHEKVHGIVKEIVMSEEDNDDNADSLVSVSPTFTSELEIPRRKLSVDDIMGDVPES